MKGLRIIPIFLVLIVCTYGGMLFIEANRAEVVIHLGSYTSPPTATGFVVLTNILIGMILCGFFCSIEILALYMQNRRLKRRLELLPKKLAKEAAAAATQDKTEKLQTIEPRTSNRFT